MGRGIVALLAIPVLFVAGMWTYRLGSPHISESVADDNALTAAQRQYGPQNSVVISAKLYPDADKLVDVHGFPIPVSMSSCPSWYPGPAAVCPPLSVWVVRVHIPGKSDVFYIVDAITGETKSGITPQVLA